MKKMLLSLVLGLSISLFFTNKCLAIAKPKESSPQQIEGVITKILENSEIIEESGNKHPYQRLQLLGTSGQYKGKVLNIENGKYDQSGVVTYSVGDRVVVSVGKDDKNQAMFTVTDFVRRTPLLLLFLLFASLAILIGGKRGASSLIGMGVTFGILFLFVLPQVSSGTNPTLVVIVASCIIIPVTFFLSHGFNKKTICAISGTLIALLITGILAGVFVNATHLSGFASEEASYLNIIKHGSIDIRGLLLGGIILGLLGVLQDITVSQAAIVYQLKSANHSISLYELFKRAMDVGRDHIASMVNTLILVYAGASLPLLLLFINNPLPFASVINFEIIAEEVMRTLVASIGLILAVPITTALTALYVEANWRAKKIAR